MTQSHALYALMAMTAFALNSLFCRLALGAELIDPMNFTTLRLMSGGVALMVVQHTLPVQQTKKIDVKTRGLLGLTLFGYALCFSLAYISLETGTGALLLFGTVQLSLIALHRFQGNRIRGLERLGILLSISGFVALMLPSASRPDLTGAALMIISGICWSGFTLLGKTTDSAIQATKTGFSVATMMMLVALVLYHSFYQPEVLLTIDGVMLALASGVLASALGYALWYRILPKISLLQASLMQLSVPVIALALGVIFVAEHVSAGAMISTGLILAGIGVVNWSKGR
ncbi:DMT family transporter [Vibrio hippocampi]|uniref:EamA domain-containing protein n=1 Tax=Vibrio hippocampi TaxID=654686 RepID=A0ABM8ZNG2_9VIBR|nr:DMT family transporter [Vibrio hippocampi]CAH0530094.1 hypothetical protein VHP8226_03822 [Vibrio hippocampi]